MNQRLRTSKKCTPTLAWRITLRKRSIAIFATYTAHLNLHRAVRLPARAWRNISGQLSRPLLLSYLQAARYISRLPSFRNWNVQWSAGIISHTFIARVPSTSPRHPNRESCCRAQRARSLSQLARENWPKRSEFIQHTYPRLQDDLEAAIDDICALPGRDQERDLSPRYPRACAWAKSVCLGSTNVQVRTGQIAWKKRARMASGRINSKANSKLTRQETLA